MEKELKSVVIVDFVGNEVAQFEGKECLDEVEKWNVRVAEEYASNDDGRVIAKDTEEYKKRYDSQLGDFYIIGYDEDGNEIDIEL